MIKKIGKCSIGYIGCEHEETFYFDDNTTEEQMEQELWEWAEQFLETWFEDDEDDEE